MARFMTKSQFHRPEEKEAWERGAKAFERHFDEPIQLDGAHQALDATIDQLLEEYPDYGGLRIPLMHGYGIAIQKRYGV